ncbi:MAG TPA: outer membrane beta-barrel protein [Xanthobacteraceae bacterium]|nr:outer membrane beta-barrel protein [Xanthobacteraceae bacterium]
MRKLLGVVAAVLFAAGVPAGATDMPMVANVPSAPLFDWNGFYVGGSFDWSLGRTHDRFFNGTQPLPIARDSFRGPLGGIEAGYCRMAVSPVVLCAEVEFDFGRARGTNYAFTTLASNTYIVSTATVDWRVTIGPKLGVAIDQNKLFIYAAGGGAFADVGFDAASTIVGSIGSGSTSGRKGGWFVGAGMERLLTPYLGVKFEYKRVEVSGLDTPLTGGTLVSTSRVEDNVFIAGVNVHFNSTPAFASY